MYVCMHVLTIQMKRIRTVKMKPSFKIIILSNIDVFVIHFPPYCLSQGLKS